jgi:hypothetical protein
MRIVFDHFTLSSPTTPPCALTSAALASLREHTPHDEHVTRACVYREYYTTSDVEMRLEHLEYCQAHDDCIARYSTRADSRYRIIEHSTRHHQ